MPYDYDANSTDQHQIQGFFSKKEMRINQNYIVLRGDISISTFC